MRIEFGKSQPVITSVGGINNRHEGWYYFYSDVQTLLMLDISPKEFKKLTRNLLKNTFESIKFDLEIATSIVSYYFYFTDPADEAFFLVWSSEGIEI